MKIFDRYFTLEFLKVFFFALFGFILMNMVFTILEVLKIESNQDPIHGYLFLLYSVPEVAARVLPAALLFGVCFTVAQFTVSREMVAVQSAGVSFYRAVSPVFITGAVLAVFLFVFQNYVVTPAKRAALVEMDQLKKETGVVRDLIWQKNLRGMRGYYFLYYFDKEKLHVVGGFNYLEMDEKNRPGRMLQAKRAVYRENTKDWELHQAVVLRIEEEGRKIGVESHERMIIAFPEDIDFFANPSRDPAELSIAELLEEIGRRSRLHFSTTQYEVQLHASFSFPLMCLVVTIVGAIVGGMGSHRSSGPLVRSVLISVGTMFLYILIFSLGKNLGNTGVLSPLWAAWGPTFLFFLLALWLVRRNRR